MGKQSFFREAAPSSIVLNLCFSIWPIGLLSILLRVWCINDVGDSNEDEGYEGEEYEDEEYEDDGGEDEEDEEGIESGGWKIIYV